MLVTLRKGEHSTDRTTPTHSMPGHEDTHDIQRDLEQHRELNK